MKANVMVLLPALGARFDLHAGAHLYLSSPGGTGAPSDLHSKPPISNYECLVFRAYNQPREEML